MDPVNERGAPAAARGDGWTETTIADAATTGSDALAVAHLALEPGGVGPSAVHDDGEAALYVIRGDGRLRVGTEAFALAPETMAWLEPGDEYRLEAGAEGLEVLVAHASLDPRQRS